LRASAAGLACWAAAREREQAARGKRPRRKPGRAGLLGRNQGRERKKIKLLFYFLNTISNPI
jgi:hypothetical protein